MIRIERYIFALFTISFTGRNRYSGASTPENAELSSYIASQQIIGYVEAEEIF
jgi:hypothetical protein